MTTRFIQIAKRISLIIVIVLASFNFGGCKAATGRLYFGTWAAKMLGTMELEAVLSKLGASDGEYAILEISENNKWVLSYSVTIEEDGSTAEGEVFEGTWAIKSKENGGGVNYCELTLSSENDPYEINAAFESGKLTLTYYDGNKWIYERADKSATLAVVKN